MEQRSKHSYTLRVYLGRDPTTGKKRYMTETVRGTKRQAQRRLAEIISEINRGLLTRPSRMTLREYLLRWLEDYAKVNVGPKTYERYEEIYRLHLIPALGKIPLADLQPSHIQSYYTKALAEAAPMKRVGSLSGQSTITTGCYMRH